MANENAVAVVDGQQSNSFLQAILQAATNPDIDATKVQTMANLAVQLQDRERETQFNAALNAAIIAMPVITREGAIVIPGKNGEQGRVQGRFARFEDIYRVVRPILAQHQLAIRFDVGNEPPADGLAAAITVTPILSHANGHTVRGEAMRLPPDTSGSKNATQAVGSSTAYGKRYALCAMLNIMTEGVDDDGRGGAPQVVIPNERQTVVLADATAAHEAGGYLEWFGTASPKDRAWLIQSGHHSAFGGQTSLPPVTPPPSPPPAAPQQPPPRTDSGTTKPTREQRAKDWVEWFKQELQGCRTANAIDALNEEHAATLGPLQSGFPTLYADVERAVDDRLASL